MATTINFPLTATCGHPLSIGNILALMKLERYYPMDFVPFNVSGINKDTINYLSERMCRGIQFEGFDRSINGIRITFPEASDYQESVEYFNKALDYLLENTDRVIAIEPFEYDPIRKANFLIPNGGFLGDNYDKIDLSYEITCARDRDGLRSYFYGNDFDTLHDDGDIATCEICETIFVYLDDADIPHVCRDCFANDYWWCSDCEGYYHHDSNCRCIENEEDEYETYYRDTSKLPTIGDCTKQFSGKRTVGIEFETQENAKQYPFTNELKDKLKRWGIHSDGSLPDDALEFVSNPISGHIILNEVIDFYELCDKYGVQIQGDSAGMHVHVNAHELFDIIGKHQGMTWGNATANEIRTRLNIQGSLIINTSKRTNEYGTTIYTHYYTRANDNFVDEIQHSDIPEEVMIMFGNAFVNLTRCFIGKKRALNNYCSSPFAFRDKGSKPKELKKTNTVSYPAIAVRSYKTFEFRLFPSTGSRNYALARIELSQKLVEHMVKLMTEQKSWDCISPIVMPDMYKFFELCASANLQDSVLPINIVDKLGDMIGLSDECQSSLQRIYQRFHLNNALSTFSL